MSKQVAEWLIAILSGFSREVAVEAAYYVARELKQSSVPVESRKEHFADASDSEPTPEAQALASRIVLAIERRENCTVVDLSHDVLVGYISDLFNAVHATTEEALRMDEERGRQLLSKLRES